MTDETLYLIAHKVRGQPAFDIAIQMQMDDEVWWIIPTSGHRAYPFWHSDLFGLIDEGTGSSVMEGYLGHLIKNMPADLPDHYWQPGQTSDLIIPEGAGKSLLASLGVAVKTATQPIPRRSL